MASLEEKIEKIGKVFDIQQVCSIPIDIGYIAKYYKVNQLAYSLFHTMNNRIYMGVSRDGVYKRADLLEAARTVEYYIKATKAAKVLELATGRGANSQYVAVRHPETTFFGVDISEGQLYFARKSSAKIVNYFPEIGDYHDLTKFEDSSVDICFVVEALCYSTDKRKVLAEVNRVLKKGGVFIVFDGYRNKSEDVLNDAELRAVKLTEVGMAVERFEEYVTFRQTITEMPWEIIKEEDVSTFVLPTMRRFEKLARAFFKFPLVARVLTKVLQPEFTYNAISGYLMPTLVENGIANYTITILRKK